MYSAGLLLELNDAWPWGQVSTKMAQFIQAGGPECSQEETLLQAVGQGCGYGLSVLCSQGTLSPTCKSHTGCDQQENITASLGTSNRWAAVFKPATMRTDVKVGILTFCKKGGQVCAMNPWSRKEGQTLDGFPAQRFSS